MPHFTTSQHRSIPFGSAHEHWTPQKELSKSEERCTVHTGPPRRVGLVEQTATRKAQDRLPLPHWGSWHRIDLYSWLSDIYVEEAETILTVSFPCVVQNHSEPWWGPSQLISARIESDHPNIRHLGGRTYRQNRCIPRGKQQAPSL